MTNKELKMDKILTDLECPRTVLVIPPDHPSPSSSRRRLDIPIKHNGWLSGSFSVSNDVKQGFVVAPASVFPVLFQPERHLHIPSRRRQPIESAPPPRTGTNQGGIHHSGLWVDASDVFADPEDLEHVIKCVGGMPAYPRPGVFTVDSVHTRLWTQWTTVFCLM